MRYAIENQDGVIVLNGDTPFPAGSVASPPIDYNPPRYYKIVNGVVVEKSEEEKRIVDLPLKFRKYENNQWVELTEEEKNQVIIAENQAETDRINAEIQAEIDRQNNKSVALKTAENNFLLLCDMLTNSTNHNKIGFTQLNTVVDAIPDPNTKIMIAIKLLAIDAECKREGGLLWWDDCIWHSII